MMSFKQSHEFDKRKTEADKIRARFPEKIPVIAEKGKNSKLIQAEKTKFLIHEDMTLAQFMVVLRRRLTLECEDALFIYVGDNTLAATSMSMGSLYKDFVDPDGFLYLTYCSENTFGGL
jgi:GABA(A) receptor-associated protein